MSLRAVAAGTLKFREVAVPVKLYLAAKEERLSFHLVHTECRTQVTSQLWCPSCQRAVDRKTECSHSLQEGEHLTLFSGDELAALEAPADGVFEVLELAPAAQMPFLRLDGTHYYVGIDSKASRDPYRVMFAAIAARKLIGLVRLSLYGRKRYAILSAGHAGHLFTLSMLYFSGEIRDLADVPQPEPCEVDRKQLAIAKQVGAAMTVSALSLAATVDEQGERVRQFVENRKAGPQAAPAEPAAPAAAVLDLTQRLKASLPHSRNGLKAERSGRAVRRAGRKRPAAAV